MKVAFSENNVLGSAGLQQTGGFQIAASAHAFKMLSSGLYSDKIRAVLREIGCNANDAHVAAGTPDRPFRVKLPNSLDDQFYVQDWGPGLSHDEVMGLYTTYFASTKQASNDFTGAFGLGSKSPFSYTDSFAVVSVHGGIKRTYSLYIGNQGAPQVSLMSEEPADKDWEHGVRVGFAVKPENYEEFKDKARVVYQWFRVSPEMRGCEGIDQPQYKYTCSDFRLLKDSTRGNITALMGNVAYPVTVTELGLQSVDDVKNAGKLLNYASVVPGIVLMLDIGTVQVAASRENLQYDPATVKVLQEKLGLAMKRLGKEVVTALQDASAGGWAELCKVGEKVDKMWGGSGLRWHFDVFAAAMGVDTATIPILQKFVGKTSVQIPQRGDTGVTTYVVKQGGKGRGASVYTRDNRRGQELTIDPLTCIAAGNAERAMSRAKRAVSDGTYNQVLIFTSPKKGGRLAESVVLTEARHASAELGKMPVIDIGTLEPFELDPSARAKRRGKKWLPTLPTGVQFPCMVGITSQMAELGSVESLFMCTYQTSRWRNVTKRVRLMEQNMDDDKRLEEAEWANIWNMYVQLQAKVKMPFGPTSYAALTSAQIKAIGLVQLGWRPAYRVIEDYMKQPDLRTELRKKIKKKHLAAPRHQYEIKGWMTGLSWWLGSDKFDNAATTPLITADLLDTLRGMLRARDASVNANAVPPEVLSYQNLCRVLKVEDDLNKDIQFALTVEDADAAFINRFPRAAVVDAKETLQNQALTLDALQFVLSKEV